MQTNHYRQIIPPCVLLEKTQQLLSELQKGTGLVDLTKYYNVESKLDLANLSKDVNIPAVFGRLIGSIQNRSMMPNVIKYWKYPDMFDQVLMRHDPKAILDKYTSSETLYTAIRQHWPEGKDALSETPKTLWKQWCAGVLSAAKFLVQFKNVEDLRKSFGMLYDNKWSRAALPALLAMEIDGLQFTLACDFLKECGYDYPKPDVHITDVFEPILKTRDTYQVFKAVIAYAEQLNMTAFQFDKMIWLVCSGNFYLDNKKCQDKKAELLKFVESAL